MECTVCYKNSGDVGWWICNDHEICLACYIANFNGNKVVCPTCDRETDIDLMSMNKCARCNVLGAIYCFRCGASLCKSCWDLIHSFFPLTTHACTIHPCKSITRDHLSDAILKRKGIDQEIQELDVKSSTSKRNELLSKVDELFDAKIKKLLEEKTRVLNYINKVMDTAENRLKYTRQDILRYIDEQKRCLFMPVISTQFPNKYDYNKTEIQFNFNQLNVDNLFTLNYTNYGRFIILNSGQFTVPFDGEATVILVGGGAAGGNRNDNYDVSGGGGSGYIKIINLPLIKGDKWNTNIGKTQLDDLCMDTSFGNYVARGADKLDPNSGFNGGSGGSGGGAGSFSSDGGRGGYGGKDGGSASSFKGGVGHCAEEFKQIKIAGVWCGEGGRGGVAKTNSSRCGGGGAGGICVDISTNVYNNFTGNCIVNAADGGSNYEYVNYGDGGEGFGAGGGAGGCGENYKGPGGDGAQGCVIIVYKSFETVTYPFIIV